MRLQQWYRENAADLSSDIAPHFPAFFDAVRSTDAHNVVELGVRQGHSSSAFLMALFSRAGARALWSIDVEPPPVPRLGGAAMRAIAWHVLVENDVSVAALDWTPPTIDVLFVDTDHAYEHTLVELDLYGPRVRPGGLILLHDTENEHPEDHGETIGPQEPFPVKRAVEHWCAERDLDWSNDPQSWGLATILV